MCTLVVSIEPGAPVLLAGIRDEMADRAWQPPGWHWPEYPGLIGGRDLVAGGTWLAVAPAARRAACVLNGRGRKAPAASRRSRGVLPLEAAAHGTLGHGRPGDPGRDRLADVDPFHLVLAAPRLGGGQAARVTWWRWDGETLSVRDLPPGLHMLVNSGLATSETGPPARPGALDGEHARQDQAAQAKAGQAEAGEAGQDQAARDEARQERERDRIGRERERARAAHFLPRLRAAARPVPLPGLPVHQAWGAWLPRLDGDGLAPADPRALIVAERVPGDRVWGTTSVSLVAIAPDWVRYDFSASPGDPAAWSPVPLDHPA
jgi:transport and Golgi organization protein 2